MQTYSHRHHSSWAYFFFLALAALSSIISIELDLHLALFATFVLSPSPSFLITFFSTTCFSAFLDAEADPDVESREEDVVVEATAGLVGDFEKKEPIPPGLVAIGYRIM